MKIGSVTAEKFLTWTNVAWTNVTMTVGIVLDVPKMLTLKFPQNWFNNS